MWEKARSQIINHDKYTSHPSLDICPFKGRWVDSITQKTIWITKKSRPTTTGRDFHCIYYFFLVVLAFFLGAASTPTLAFMLGTGAFERMTAQASTPSKAAAIKPVPQFKP